jgi:hypothetical protein
MSGKQDSGPQSKNSVSSTPTPRSPIVTTGVPTTRPMTSAVTSPSSKATVAPTADDVTTGAVVTTPVEIVGTGPTSLDGQFQSLGVVPAAQQPNFPTVWPPLPPLPVVQLGSAGMIPWRQWIENMAVRPYPTDPPPCPVVVSRYPGLTTN